MSLIRKKKKSTSHKKSNRHVRQQLKADYDLIKSTFKVNRIYKFYVHGSHQGRDLYETRKISGLETQLQKEEYNILRVP